MNKAASNKTGESNSKTNKTGSFRIKNRICKYTGCDFFGRTQFSSLEKKLVMPSSTSPLIA